MTKLTWMNVIRIVEEAFELIPADISRCLGVRRSTITRLRNGFTKKPRSSLTHKMIYEKLFDPTTGPVNYKEETMLDHLKDSVAHFGFKEIMGDVWDKKPTSNEANRGSVWGNASVPIDYRTFVLTMLKRTCPNPKLSKPKAAEQMLKMLREIVERCSLTNFLENSVTDLKEWDDLQSRVDVCIQAIDEDILQPLDIEEHKNNFMYRNIQELHLGLAQWFNLSLLAGSFSEQPGFRHDLDDAFRRIYSSYDKIIESTPPAAEYSIVIPKDCDENVKAILLSEWAALSAGREDVQNNKTKNPT